MGRADGLLGYKAALRSLWLESAWREAKGRGEPDALLVPKSGLYRRGAAAFLGTNLRLVPKKALAQE
jgi:hypothetical protein